MNIQQFQYVLAVHEYQHFELAAEKCFVTQSTLSTMISKFEDEIGIKIFDRKKKPVQLTTEGLEIVKQLQVISKNIAAFKELTQELKGEITGTLSLSVIPTVAPFLLPLFLQDFARKFPNLNIIVREETTAEIIRKLKSRALDIGILSTPINDKEIIEYPLYDEPFLFYDAEQVGCAEVAAKSIDLNNLCVMEEGHCMRTQVLQICDQRDRLLTSKLNFEYKAGSIDGLLRFVKANKAATFLPYLATTDFPEAERLHLSSFSNPIPYRTIGLVVHNHFVKNKLLHILQKEISDKVVDQLPKIGTTGAQLNPLA
ncbi:LysR substrate-binding domain-containing protein [Flavobacterium sp.]|uniref:LysR substrate-binding domain-containing protein n=1 Tax=Flavobacterium sp. TaxID=239 RepID=UPI003B9AC577